MANDRRRRLRREAGGGLPPVLLLLLLAVVAPTICILWFMAEAVKNERLAVRQKLTEVFQSQLVDARKSLVEFWTDRAQSMSSGVQGHPGPWAFREILKRFPDADSVILYDAQGQFLYPVNATPRMDFDRSASEPWMLAESAEFERKDPAAAAELYAKCGDDPLTVQARIRCLIRSGRRDEAGRLFAEKLDQPSHRQATDSLGRWIVPDAQLALAQAVGKDNEFGRTLLNNLAKRLNDYETPAMPSSQRSFLMIQAAEAGCCAAFPTLAAEMLAVGYAETNRIPGQPGKLIRATADKVWQLTSEDGRVTLLFRQDGLVKQMQSLIASRVTLSGISVAIVPKTQESARAPFQALPVGGVLPDWELRLFLNQPDPFAAAEGRQVAIYLWGGVLVIVTIGVSAGLMGLMLFRQMKVAQLKNDFVATVSHELKTPLASMRVLVDTLKEGNYRDPSQAKEYLELIGKENERLSRLIDNFLTFSRMERNKRSFEFVEVRAQEIVEPAVEAIGEKFRVNGFDLRVEIDPKVPGVTADRDAMVTVLLNLLDNAYKYSENEKQVSVRVYAQDDRVCFEVRDRGIGLSRRDTRRIFERFYQVDQTLSRKTGGCGLGLSIVKFIVQAHGGEIHVDSQPGRGSTFVVRLPASGAETTNE